MGCDSGIGATSASKPPRDADLAKVTVADRLEVVKAAQLAFEQSQPERVRSVSRIASDHSSCL
jgi:hypothetical protein